VSESFGRRILGKAPAEVLSAERAAGKSDTWARLDAANTHLLLASLAATKIAASNGDSLELLGLSEDDRLHINESFHLTDQQSRGAWFLPERASLDLGTANLPYHFLRHPRFACGIAKNTRIEVNLRSASEGLYFWAVLEPLFQLLFRPFFLRSTNPPATDRESSN
jgi:hypothetical protein